MATDTLPFEGIKMMVEPMQKTSKTLAELAANPDGRLEVIALLLSLVISTKHVARKLESVIAQLRQLDTMSEWDLQQARRCASELGQSSNNSYKCASVCRSILDSRKRHQFVSVFLLRIIIDDFERLAVRLEDTSETLALSASKPFTDFVRKELTDHA